MLSQLRSTPEAVKRRLRPVVVWIIRGLVAVPGGRLLARFIQRLMPDLSSWLLRRYRIYRQGPFGTDQVVRRTITLVVPDDLSAEEALHYRWVEAALRHSRTR